MKTKKYYKNLLERSLESTEGGVYSSEPYTQPFVGPPYSGPNPIYRFPDLLSPYRFPSELVPSGKPEPPNPWTSNPTYQELFQGQTPPQWFINMWQSKYGQGSVPPTSFWHLLGHIQQLLITPSGNPTYFHNVDNILQLLMAMYGNNQESFFNAWFASQPSPSQGAFPIQHFNMFGNWYTYDPHQLDLDPPRTPWIRRPVEYIPPGFIGNAFPAWHSGNQFSPLHYGIPLGVFDIATVNQILNNPNYYNELDLYWAAAGNQWVNDPLLQGLWPNGIPMLDDGMRPNFQAILNVLNHLTTQPPPERANNATELLERYFSIWLTRVFGDNVPVHRMNQYLNNLMNSDYFKLTRQFAEIGQYGDNFVRDFLSKNKKLILNLIRRLFGKIPGIFASINPEDLDPLDYGQGYDPNGVMIAGMGGGFDGGFGGGFGESTSYKLAFKNYLRECLRYR
jgi:hypothetical protein